MSDSRIAAFHQEADKLLQYLQQEYGRLQTGRANASIFENVDVEAYGQRMPIKAVASISVQDARTIVIQPWDKSVMQAIEKGIMQSNIGVNPMNDGIVIRISLPPMTEERREQMKKIVHKLAEEARISVRQIRQKVQDHLKDEKDEDIRKGLLDHLQKEVDAINGRIDDSRKMKEEEVMKI